MGIEASCTCVHEVRENNRGGKDEVLMAATIYLSSVDLKFNFKTIRVYGFFINILN